MEFETKILHAVPVDELTGAISVPIYQTSTFVQEAPGLNQGFDYSRSGNPTRQVLENLVAGLENGASAAAFGSGLAAIDAVIKLLSAGDEILAVDNIYGGTFRIFTHIFSKFGINVRYADTTDLEATEESFSPKTRLLWLETPTNPTLKISDIERLADLAHAHDALLVVDNTFASPALQRPLDLGADVVIHSATKYLGGHSDLIAGIAVAKDPEIGEQIRFIQNSSGGVLGPFDAWLTIRGIETLPLRIERQSRTALELAEYLANHPDVEEVYYPGLKSHPNHELAAKQQKAFGGVISFSLKEDTVEAAERLVTSTQLFKLAESLGGVKSLLCHPASMTHGSVPRELRLKAGIRDSLVRLSVGLEHPGDLVEDLELAFEAAQLRLPKAV